MGDTATNPRLLDHLAAELVSEDWRLKEVHRQIVCSAVYKQSSIAEQNSHHDRAEEVDAENNFLWHAPLRRRDAESLRDSALVAAEDINSQMFGQSVLPVLPAALVEDRYSWEPTPQPGAHVRRSVYLLVKRNLQYPLFTAFDHPNRVASCAARPVTIGAPQALLWLNGEFLRGAARRMAGDILQETGRAPTEIVQQAYDRVFNRSPEPDEMQSALNFLQQQAAKIARSGNPVETSLPEPSPTGINAAQAAAIVDFCQALMNSAEFVYVD
jgi:hypothetical protein